ncbi:MAG: hypothetical protein J6S78_06965 [Lachnospiraceae bacterium]|nr:hypothetical protein [Lachnospiraceae bacterium]
MNYWGYRIDTRARDYFYEEIEKGNLRQGWGYMESQNLMLGERTDESARGNFPIYERVKKGDILLVPRVGNWNNITIVEATEDFNTGYRFEIDSDRGDYGHIFPVRLITEFSRKNINVAGEIRETLKCRSRFWNANRCKESIDKIIALGKTVNLIDESDYDERFRKKVEKAFYKTDFFEIIYKDIKDSFQASEWEFLLCEGFKKICPETYIIETTSNKEEKKHGADILIRIPGILDKTYIITIQVKDYHDVVGDYVIEQVDKAREYFEEREGTTLIDRYLFVIKAHSEENSALIKKAEAAGVKILFAEDVKRVLNQMAKAYIGDIEYN